MYLDDLILVSVDDGLRRRAEGHGIDVRSMGRGRVESGLLNLGEMSKLATGR
jgi:hypothetical protein